MKTCINCIYRDQEDGCCWGATSILYSEEVDETTKACEDFEPEEEAEDGAIAYAWFHWIKSYRGNCTIKWL